MLRRTQRQEYDGIKDKEDCKPQIRGLIEEPEVRESKSQEETPECKSIIGNQRYRERSFEKLPEMNLANHSWFCVEKD